MRAARSPGAAAVAWPDVDGVLGCLDWMRQIWRTPEVADVIDHANPGFARRVRALCNDEDPSARQVRRSTLSMARYVMRLTGRPTPSGLFAGVAPVAFGTSAGVVRDVGERAEARADSAWLADVIGQLEACPAALSLVAVVRNSAAYVRGDRLVVSPHLDHREAGASTVEVSLRYGTPVRAALQAARAPIGFGELVEKVQASFPATPGTTVLAMLTGLVRHRALVTSLHAPATEPDALGHLVDELAATGAGVVEPVRSLARALGDAHRLLEAHGHLAPSEARTARDEAAAVMLRYGPATRHPVALDVRLSGDLVLPDAVAADVESAALALARLSPYPTGRAAWRDYHRRFYERFGVGALVPVLDVVADSGIGWPAGYPGTAPEGRRELTRRDEALVALAQEAVLDGAVEVVVDETLIARLAVEEGTMRLPPHLELSVRIDADDTAALGAGAYRLTVLSVSRGAGVGLGRFLDVVDDGPSCLAASLADLSTADQHTVPAQLSFPPMDASTAHVARSARVLPVVVSLGEHRTRGTETVLTVDQLTVGCDSHRLFLAVPELGKRVEPWAMHALNPRLHTPPLARFLAELPRALCAQVTDFDWGAATALPFLPRLRSGRTVLSPATWRLHARELPSRTAGREAWDTALAGWRSRRRAPARVLLRADDRRLPVDLDVPLHRALLRDHLASKPLAVLEEAPAEGAAGWCGGRAHEVVVPLAAEGSPPWPEARRPRPDQVVKDERQAPGASSLLFAKLYGDVRRQDEVLERLPDLLAAWGEDEPVSWFLRYREGKDHYLRLRVRLPAPAAFGAAADRVTTWANGLCQAGLLREVSYATSFPDVGRWGRGPALAAAEEVFAADSRVVLTQLAVRDLPPPRALVAANFVSIAAAFTGGTAEGVAWLVDGVPPPAPCAVARLDFAEAVRVSDPRDGFPALRRVPAGAELAASWERRSEALARYRSYLSGPHTAGVDVDDALRSLLHTHFLRAQGVDHDEKAVCLYLARAAALAYVARTGARR